MTKDVIFLLDNDKKFLNTYGPLLKNKGCHVFATDNLFLVLKYAQTAKPAWVFIDENFAAVHEIEIVKMIENVVPLNRTRFAIMSNTRARRSKNIFPNIEFVYKPKVLEKMIKISEKSCIIT